MLHGRLKLLAAVCLLCAANAICRAQVIPGRPAPPEIRPAEDRDNYPDLPIAPTRVQVKHAAAAQNAVLNYLGAPPSSSHFSNKLTYYLASTFSSRNAIEAGLIAGIPNLPAAPTQPSAPPVLDAASGAGYEAAFQSYGDKIDVWRRTSEVELRYRGNRAAVGLATSESRMLLSNFLLPVALRQGGRYEPADINAPFGARVGHAFASLLVARTDRGTLAPNYSKLIGTAGAALAGRMYYADALGAKELDSSRFMASYIGYSLAGDLATNLGRELIRTAERPDILRFDEAGPPLQQTYYPLSFGGKFFNWARSTYDLRNFVEGGLIAGLPHIATQPEFPPQPVIDSVAAELAYDGVLTRYGAAEQLWRDNLEQDVRYHGRRFIAGLSESETQTTLAKLILPTALRMEPRYISVGAGHSPGARLASAFAGLVMTRMDSGRRMANFPLLAGNVGAALIAREYYYPQLGVDSLTSNKALGKTIGFNLAGNLLVDLISEFFPHHSF